MNRRLMVGRFMDSKVFERQADIGKLRQTSFGADRMSLLQKLLNLLQVTGFCRAFRLNQDLPNGLLFFHGYRLGEREERVKEKNKLIFKAGRKGRIHWGKWGEINSRKAIREGENRSCNGRRNGQSSQDDGQAMEERNGAVSQRERLASDFKRFERAD